MKVKDLKGKKLDIFLLFGQSNAEGQGLGNEELIPAIDEKMHTLVHKKPIFYKVKYGPQDEIYSSKFICPLINPLCVAPLNYFMDNTPRNGSFAGEFCRLYKEKYLSKDREILVICSAVGGTGFADGKWLENGILTKKFLKMIDIALSLNKENRIICALFHQGERDSIGTERLGDIRYNFYNNEICKLISNLRNRYSSSQIPFISGEFSNEWCKTEEGKESYIIEKCLHDLEKKLPLCGCASSEGLKSNNEEIGNGDNIHFSRKSCIELGKRYFAIYENLIKQSNFEA